MLVDCRASDAEQATLNTVVDAVLGLQQVAVQGTQRDGRVGFLGIVVAILELADQDFGVRVLAS